MAFQPLEKLLPRSNFSIYKLVLIAAQRATEIADGQKPLIDFPSQKATTTALDEIVAGKVILDGAQEKSVVQKGKVKNKAVASIV